MAGPGHRPHRAADGGRPCGGDHTVERSVHAGHLEGGARAGRGQQRGAQAGRVVPAVGFAAGRPDGGGRTAARRLQPGSGNRRRGRCGPDRGSAGPPHQLHRLTGDGPAHRRGRGGQHRAVHGRTGRQGSAHRVRRLRPRSGRRPGRGPVRGLGSGVPGRKPPAGRGLDPRRVPGGTAGPHRGPRAGRQPRRCHHHRASGPPRPPGQDRGLRGTGLGRGRRRRLGRPTPRRLPPLRAHADRAGVQHLRDRPARGIRPGPDHPGIHDRGRGGGAGQLHPLRPFRHRLHRLSGPSRTGRRGRCGPGSCGPTPSWFETWPPPSAAAAYPASAARAATTPSTSTATSRL